MQALDLVPRTCSTVSRADLIHASSDSVVQKLALNAGWPRLHADPIGAIGMSLAQLVATGLYVSMHAAPVLPQYTASTTGAAVIWQKGGIFRSPIRLSWACLPLIPQPTAYLAARLAMAPDAP